LYSDRDVVGNVIIFYFLKNLERSGGPLKNQMIDVLLASPVVLITATGLQGEKPLVDRKM